MQAAGRPQRLGRDCRADVRPRTEIVYTIESFRAALRQGEWKLIWRTLLPSTVDLYDLTKDPSEQTNLAEAHLEKVAAMKARLDALAKEAAKALFQYPVGVAHTNMRGEPVMPTEEGFGSDDGHP